MERRDRRRDGPSPREAMAMNPEDVVGEYSYCDQCLAGSLSTAVDILMPLQPCVSMNRRPYEAVGASPSLRDPPSLSLPNVNKPKSPSRRALLPIGVSASTAHSHTEYPTLLWLRTNLSQHRRRPTYSDTPAATNPHPARHHSLSVGLNSRENGDRVDRPVGTCVPEAASHLPQR